MNFLSRNLLVRRGSGRGRGSLHIPKFFLDSEKYVSLMGFCKIDSDLIKLNIFRKNLYFMIRPPKNGPLEYRSRRKIDLKLLSEVNI